MVRHSEPDKDAGLATSIIYIVDLLVAKPAQCAGYGLHHGEAGKPSQSFRELRIS